MNNINLQTSFDRNPPVEVYNYDESIRHFCGAYEAIFDLSYAYLRSMVRVDGELLIVGAGTGMEICHFGQKNPLWKMTGIDPSKDMLSLAEEKMSVQRITNLVKFFCGYTDQLPETQSYDGATCILVMHFLSDDGSKLQLLKSISSRLKKEAAFILVDGFANCNDMTFEQTVSAWKTHVKATGIAPDIVEDGFNNQILKRLQLVPENRMEALLLEAGFDKPYRFFTSFLYGGWVMKKK